MFKYKKYNKNIIILLCITTLIIASTICGCSNIAPYKGLSGKYNYVLKEENSISRELDITEDNLKGFWVCDISDKDNNANIMCLDFKDNGVMYDITAGVAYTKNRYKINENKDIEYNFIGKNPENTATTPIILYINSLMQDDDKYILNISYSDSNNSDEYSFIKVNNDYTTKAALNSDAYYINTDYETSDDNMGDNMMLHVNYAENTVQILSPTDKRKFDYDSRNETLVNSEDITEYKFIRNNGNIILDKYNTYAETNNKDTRKFVHILSK